MFPEPHISMHILLKKLSPQSTFKATQSKFRPAMPLKPINTNTIVFISTQNESKFIFGQTSVDRLEYFCFSPRNVRQSKTASFNARSKENGLYCVSTCFFSCSFWSRFNDDDDVGTEMAKVKQKYYKKKKNHPVHQSLPMSIS